MICRFLVNRVDRYAIELRNVGGFYSLHAVEYPPDPYRRSASEHHLYDSGEICVSSGHKPQTVDRAKAIAMTWCEGWSVYIRTGAFPRGAKRVNVRN